MLHLVDNLAIKKTSTSHEISLEYELCEASQVGEFKKEKLNLVQVTMLPFVLSLELLYGLVCAY